MGLSALVIVVEKNGSPLQFDRKDAASCIEAMFNPNKLSIVRNANWDDQHAAKRDNPEMQYTGSPPATLTLELFFDTYDTPELHKASVLAYVQRLRRLTMVEGHGSLHRPPVCQLWWGEQAMLMQAVLTGLETHLTMFMDDGTPVRATNTCTFKQWRSNAGDLKRQDLLSADVAKVWVVRQGQSLASIAAAEYGDPRQWRIVAEANDIDDPLAIAPGRRLLLPARRTAWNRSRQP